MAEAEEGRPRPDGAAVDPGRRGSRRRRVVRRLSAVGVIVSIVTVGALVGITQDVFAGFQRRSADALQPGAVRDDRVVVVGIDRSTVAAVGAPWPWPRDLIARVVEGIADAGAEVLMVDLVLVGERPGDARLATALESVPTTILAASFELSEDAGEPILTARVVSGPDPSLASAADGVAHAEVFPDPADAVVRSVPLVLETPEGDVVPALSLAAYQTMTGAEGPPTIRTSGVQVGSVLIPTREKTAMTINYAAELTDDPSSPAFVSAGEVLDGLEPGALDGAVVLLGATDPTLGDQKLTPTAKDTGLPGVVVHANALSTMLTESFLWEQSTAVTIAWVAALAALVALAVLFLHLFLAAVVVAALAALHLLFTFARFEGGQVPELVYTNLAIVVAFMIAVGLKYVLETRHRRHISRLFERYVPEQVARELVEEGHRITTEGVRAEVTVFFCDLRGFTAMSAERSPAEVRDILNVYYREIVTVILRHDGTVMQFVGDEVFAIFGAPLAMAGHREQAMAAALDAQHAAGRINGTLAEQGHPAVHYGIGLHAGEVVVGHVGDAHRLQYTVIGDTVNVGSRFCSLARGGEIVCSGEVLGGVRNPPTVEKVGAVDLKGVAREIQLYRVPPPARSLAADLPREDRRLEKAVEKRP